jgi:tetratricopeptide (TPR) repeat protein
MILRPLIWAVALALLLPPVVRAGESWVGLKVLATKPKVQLRERVGDKEIGFDLTGALLPVLKDQGGRLRVRDYHGKEGWADKTNFVRLPDAPACFTTMIRKDPTNVWAWTMRANAWVLNGDHDQAIRDHTEAIRLDPKCVTAYYGRAGAWANKQAWGKAIRDLDEAWRIDPVAAAPLGPAVFHNFRGCLWLGQQDYDQAIRDFDKAIRLDPQCAPAFNLRGNAWEEKHEHDKAIRDYTEAIRLGLKDRFFEKDASVFVNRGNLWLAKREYVKALQDYDDALRLDPNYGMALGQKAYLLATCADDKVRDMAAAEKLSKAVVQLQPKSPYNEELLGVIAAAQGRFDEAITHQQQALEDKRYAERQGAKAHARLRSYTAKKPYRE